MPSQQPRRPDDPPSGEESASGSENTTLTDAQTVRELIESEEPDKDQSNTGQIYRCLDCNVPIDGFPVECPECGSNSFERTDTHEGNSSETPAEELLDTYAELTAPYNPYVPR